MTVMSPQVANNENAKPAPEFDLTTVGGRVAYLRVTNMMEQEELAERLGTKAPAISRWENNKGGIGPKQAMALAVMFGTSTDWILRGVGETPRPRNRPVMRVAEGAPGARFPLSALLRLPDVRARLSAIQSELIELGATPEYEENVMRTLRDRAFLSRFAGGSADDQYTEAELLQAIDNIAESARRFLAGPTL